MIARHRAHQASQQMMDTTRHPHCVPLVCEGHIHQSSVISNPSSESLEILNQFLPLGTLCLRVSCALDPSLYGRQASWSPWANICIYIQLLSEHACINKKHIKHQKQKEIIPSSSSQSSPSGSGRSGSPVISVPAYGQSSTMIS